MQSASPLFALLVVVACGGREPRDVQVGGPSGSAAQTADAAVAPPPPVVTSPHTGRIVQIATTDRADAALTFDNTGAMRLWPILDGTQEPVVVRAPEPEQIALGRDGSGLVAAIVDEAGGVEVLRFDARGGVLGRVKLVPEPAVAEVVIAGGHVVARRRDETLARFASDGTPRGVLAADPGQRLVSLATRRDAIVVGTGDAVRFVTSAFAWGKTYALPVRLTDVALAPGGGRIAGFAADNTATIVDLEPVRVAGAFKPQLRVFVPKSRRATPRPAPRPVIGFTADDTAVASGPDVRWAP